MAILTQVEDAQARMPKRRRTTLDDATVIRSAVTNGREHPRDRRRSGFCLAGEIDDPTQSAHPNASGM
jgi:hypothetical protein